MAEKRPKQGNSGVSPAAFEDISGLTRLEADLSTREHLLQTIIDAEPE